MPYYATFFRRHKAFIRYPKPRLWLRHTSWPFSSLRRWRISKKSSDRDGDLEMLGPIYGGFENELHDGNTDALTLGSAVGDGRFRETVKTARRCSSHSILDLTVDH